MRPVRAWVKGLAIAALAAMGCNAPDSSPLFRPTQARGLRGETPGVQVSSETPSTGVGVGVGGSAAAGAGSGGTLPPFASGGAPAGSESPASTDAAAEPLPEQPPPSPPEFDAGPPNAPPTPDAGGEPPSPPPAEPECAGVLLDGVCWYLGELDEACDSVCAARGGVAPGSAARIGTPAQGGSLEACAAILEGLGAGPVAVMEGFRDDNLGFGCHVFLDVTGATSAWWLTSPPFSPAVSDPSARLVCGCAG